VNPGFLLAINSINWATQKSEIHTCHWGNHKAKLENLPDPPENHQPVKISSSHTQKETPWLGMEPTRIRRIFLFF